MHNLYFKLNLNEIIYDINIARNNYKNILNLKASEPDDVDTRFSSNLGS